MVFPAPRSPRVIGIVAGLAGGVVMTGCGGGSGPVAAVGGPTPTATTTACPGATAPSHVGDWPAPVPADFPKPPSGERAHVSYRSTILTVVLVRTAMSLQQSVVFVLRALPPKGFVLGRGDAEPAQADAPFTRSGVVGQLRLNWLAPCTTQWLIAIGTPRNGSGSPLLPLRPSASPVPFTSFGPSTFGG